MPTIVAEPATLDDLMRVEGKAELINGRIVQFMASGNLPSEVAFLIAIALRAYAQVAGGIARPDGVGYAVGPIPSGRQSFQPDASYYTGPLPANPMRFISGPPNLAVEVRSESDYGPAADRDYADKRADYFAAGTLTVWDVDPLTSIVTSYRADGTSASYGIGDVADAEPACPGWRVAVTELFPSSE